MDFKAYGDEMLQKQLKLAEKKGNKDYSASLKAELAKRAAKRKSLNLPSAKRSVSDVGKTLVENEPKPEPEVKPKPEPVTQSESNSESTSAASAGGESNE